MGIEVLVSTRSQRNIERARKEGAIWAADTSKKDMPGPVHAAIVFPPAGNLVEPALSQVELGGTVVLAPVSSSPITIKNYSENLWGRSIKTLYNLNRKDAEELLQLVKDMDPEIATVVVPFEELQDALIQVKHGNAAQPNVVIQVS